MTLVFLVATIAIGGLNRRISEAFPEFQLFSSVAGIFLATFLTATFIARRGELISPRAAAFAVSIPIVLLGLLLAVVYYTDPGTSFYQIGLAFGVGLIFYGIPSYWLLVKLPTSGLLSSRFAKADLPLTEITRGFWLFPVVLFAVSGSISLVLAGLVFWFGDT